MMAGKMLYISHVDWKWIKQRPHFIAEQLRKKFDVSVLYVHQNRNRKNLQKRDISKENASPLFSIPLSGRIRPLSIINDLFIRMQIVMHMKHVKPEYIYLTHPLQLRYLPAKLGARIIYDCMDDHLELGLKSQRQKTQQAEKELIRRSAVVLVSSGHLKHVLLKRYGSEWDGKFNVVRNGYSGEILSQSSGETSNKGEFVISYVGTIGHWFNFDFILRSIQDIPDLRYRIIGPADTVLPQSPRIEYTGTVEHEKLYDMVKTTDCLIMPFLLNDIVLSVDPVKLYEYINYNMNILCVEYPEVQRFAPFVYFYSDYEEFIKQIKKLMQDNTIKYSNEDREAFLKQNSWADRAQTICEIIEG